MGVAITVVARNRVVQNTLCIFTTTQAWNHRYLRVPLLQNCLNGFMTISRSLCSWLWVSGLWNFPASYTG